MKAKLVFLLLFIPLCIHSILYADETKLQYFLPDNSSYDQQLSEPESVLGFQVGQWHARHDQVIAYMRHLAEQSPRLSIIEIGKTWEQRPQILVVVTAPENQARIEELIAEREQGTQKQDSPLFVWLGYSVHGNEASGTNASLLSAYHLAAKTGEQHEQFLRETVILIEPSLNPDGYGRFSTWANNNRGTHLSADPVDREHLEDWPMGRTNHYRFDLNRDWLLAQQPESKARLEWFHKLKPHVLGDFHEMGPNSTYFFQPGVPSRQNPLTPEENFKITDDIAKFHGKILDEAGSLYYSKQGFDDFYIGKGSTYPDINGSIGILFEQASSRGHLQNTVNGPLSFPFAIRNQFLTTLSTLEGAHVNRDRLIDYQQAFYDKSLAAARNDNSRAVVISDDGDPARMTAFIDILLRHKITAYQLAAKVKVNDVTIDSGIIIPFNQPQYRLIKSLFETRTRFKDNTFYDVSTWNLAYSFNLPFGTVSRKSWHQSLLGDEITSANPGAGAVEAVAKVAYAFDWNHYQAAAALNSLLKKDLRVRVAGKAFTSETDSGKQSFSTGSIVIPVGLQQESAEQLHQLMQELASEFHLKIAAIQSGYALAGIDLGSRNMQPLSSPKPLLLTGKGVSSYDSGEIWFMVDQHLKMPLSQVKLSDFKRLSLRDYTHLILVKGNYASLQQQDIEAIRQWIDDGGVLIAMKSAVKWVEEHKLLDISLKKNTAEQQENEEAFAYSSMEHNDAQKVIGGSIFATNLDTSHPLAFGYQRDFLPVFRNHTLIMEPSKNPYATIAKYRKEPLLSGFVSDENIEKIAGSAMMMAERKGKGSVILILDNPVFRGVWYGTSRLFINSLFFGRAFKNPSGS